MKKILIATACIFTLCLTSCASKQTPEAEQQTEAPQTELSENTEENNETENTDNSETSEEDAEALGERIREQFGDCEVEVAPGGQPIYYYIMSVE